MPEPTQTPPAAPPAGSDAGNKLYDQKPPAGTPPAIPPASDQKPNSDAGKGGDQTPPPADSSKADDKSKGDAGQSERIVPEKYDLKLPDGSLLDAKALAQVNEFAKANKLTNQEAQAVLERESNAIASYVESQKAAVAEKQKAWIESVKTDKEIGGDGLGKNVEMAKRVIDRYGSDAFRQALNESGLGNHPELVRLLVRVGKAMSEDQLVIPGTTSGAKKSMEDLFYPQPAQQ